jgi:predicted ABC-type exoprotein transport system permease subunit
MNDIIFDIGYYVTIALVAIAAISVIIFPIFFFIQDIRKAKGALIGIAVLAAVLFFSYFISTNETYEGVSPMASQWIGGGITATMILIGIGLVAAVFTEIYKLFR